MHKKTATDFNVFVSPKAAFRYNIFYEHQLYSVLNKTKLLILADFIEKKSVPFSNSVEKRFWFALQLLGCWSDGYALKHYCQQI